MKRTRIDKDMLKRYMEWQNLTQASLADRAGVSRPHIHRILDGESFNLRLETVDRIANAVGVDTFALLKRVEE